MKALKKPGEAPAHFSWYPPKNGTALAETGIVEEQLQSEGPRSSRQRGRKPLGRSEDGGQRRLHRTVQPKYSHTQCMLDCAVEGSAHVIIRGPVA